MKRRRCTTHRGSIAALLTVLSFMPGTLIAQGATSEPLIQASSVTYLGAFALPSWAGQPNGAYGTSWFEYGGHALTFYKDPITGKRTLYMEGHAQLGGVAQVEIPSTLVNSTNWSALPKANLLQPFVSVPSSPDPASCVGNPAYIYGMLGYNNRLIIGAACSYGGAQTTSHGVRSLNLSTSGFQGFYGFTGAAAPPRALGGPMIAIPSEWQPLLGGPAFTSLYAVSVTGSTSDGPTATVFNPNDVGVVNPIPGKTVLFYSLDHQACGYGVGGGANDCSSQQQTTFNLTSVGALAAFVPGTRSVLVVQAQGIGCYWYGGWNEPNSCGVTDPYLTDVKGPHAPPYRYQINAYDANDLLAVKNGTKQTWEPMPYAIIPLNGMPNSDNDKFKGATFDPETDRLYVTQDYGTNPRVEVYQITVPNTAPPPATRFYPVTPCRVADTRNAAGASGGPALTANADRTFPVGGLCGIPMDAASVAVNATVTQPTAAGFVRMWSASDPAPDTTALSFAAGKTRANNGIVRLGGGSVSARYELDGGGSGTTHFILDVVGYFR